MAGPFYVDDGGDGSTESSWATADTSINALDAEYAFASGEIVYFGHNHVCQAANSANLTITGPTASPPISFISATQGSSPVAYEASTTAQIDTTEGAYNIVFDGAFALYGMSLVSGNRVVPTTDANEGIYCENCRFALGANAFINFVGQGNFEAKNLLVDLTADATTARASAVFVATNGSNIDIQGLTFNNAGYRTGTIFDTNAVNQRVRVSGADFSGFDNATLCEMVNATMDGSRFEFSNCLTAATWAPIPSGAVTETSGEIILTNCGPADDPTYLYFANFTGTVISSSAIYRSSGATVESAACSWLITTNSACAEGYPLESPWIYATISSTGSKTFTVYITNDTADFTDSEVWLEVEYLSTSNEAITAIATDHRTITTTAAAQTDDTASTWNGTGPSFTYKQSLAVTATVNEDGLYRARVCCGVASIAGSRYFYVDPLVTVT
jgi:hypothetical protein